jgi:hypothetical protein
MNIIFGRDQALVLAEKYTVLELDTIRVKPANTEITAFCVIESMPIMDMPKVESMKNLHENLIAEYKKRDWNYCTQALEHLTGFWGHEIDTFYDSIRARIRDYSKNEPGDDWDGIIEK